jgi:glycosyltransferase involved in cell wall biosynthesis
MRILFASAHPYLPQIAGGTQSNTDEIVRGLLPRGHAVGVLAGLTGEGWTGLRGRLWLKLLKRGAVLDHSQRYPVYRSWYAWDGAREVASHFRPDVVVVQSGSMLRVARAFRRLGVPTVLYFHNVEFEDHAGDIADFVDNVMLANSRFTAERYRRAFGVEPSVVNPFFESERYVVESRRERVLFVNPHPLKGVDVALEVAALCPDIPFDFLESWTLSPSQREALRARVAALPNVTLHPRTSDIRAYYATARVVFVPSQWEETWGRIASEAHFSRIPVLGSRIGGLTEAIGPGGMLLDPSAPAQRWAAALRRLWDDEGFYAGLCAAALDYARRPELDREHQLDALEAALQAALERSPAQRDVEVAA